MSGPSRWSPVLTNGEWQEIRDGYDRLLGPGEVDELFRFVPFMHEVRPDALKRYRLFIDTVTQGSASRMDCRTRPSHRSSQVIFTPRSRIRRGSQGISSLQQVGGKKQEVADILTLAFLHARTVRNEYERACRLRRHASLGSRRRRPGHTMAGRLGRRPRGVPLRNRLQLDGRQERDSPAGSRESRLGIRGCKVQFRGTFRFLRSITR